MVFARCNPRCRAAPPARVMIESLEPRALLSAAYYGWFGVESLPGYAAEYGDPEPLVGMSENGTYKWSESAADRSASGEPYIVLDRQVRYLRDDSMLHDAQIAGINSDGMLFGWVVSGSDAGSDFLYDLTGGGTRRPLSQADFDAPAGFSPASAEPLGITDGGGLLWGVMNQAGDRQTLWATVGRSVWQLWGRPWARYTTNPLFWDTNAFNAVIGYREDTPWAGTHMFWSPESGLIDLGAQHILGAGSVNDDGTLFVKMDYTVGEDQPLALWRDGQIELLSYEDDYVVGFGGTIVVPAGRDGAGRLVVRNAYANRDYSETTDEFIDPNGQLYFRHDHGERWGELLTLYEGGQLLSSGPEGLSPRAGWYGLIAGAEYLAADPAEHAVPWINDGRLEFMTRRTDGTGIPFYKDGDTAGHIEERWTPSDNFAEWDVMVSPVTGDMMLVHTAGGFLYVRGTYEGAPNRMDDRLESVGRFIDRAVTGFFLPDGRPVIAGLDSDGNLQTVFINRSYPANPHGSNISEDHLAPRGMQTPEFTSQLDSFSTRWGAMNILGLDADGDLHAVWWSPASDGWRVADLSALTGAPKLTGNINASATAWNGMQVFGTDARGHAIAIWWSPTSGGWRWDDLSALTAGEPLVPGSIAGATTRWNAIELVGRTADDQVATYWWAPGREAWTYESITLQQSGSTPRIVGPVSLALGPDGSQHIAGVSADGEVIHLYWLPDAQDLWRGENLTELAIG